jgi:hypothetical protein
MSPQRVVVSVIAAVLLLALSQVVAAQTKTFTTPWGHPDLQGVWNNQTPVPMERPEEFKSKATFTPEEAKEYERTHPNRILAFLANVDPARAPRGPRKPAASRASRYGWTTRRSPATFVHR